MTNRRKSNKIVEPVVVKPTQESSINNILETRVRLKCRNEKQKEYANLISDKEIVICSGPAGTGKTFIAVARAIELLQNKNNKYEKLILCKPAIEAGEKLGFLPGNLREKMAPIMESLVDVIDKLIGETKRLELEESGVVKLQTLAYVRGKTIDNAILVLDEAQNMTDNQVKTLLTRIGTDSKFIISGDLDQSDVFRDFKQSGLYDAISRHKNIPEIGFFEFGVDDIVRNPIISKILKNYSTEPLKVDKPKILLTENKNVNNIVSKDDKKISMIKKNNRLNLLYKRILNKFTW